MGDTQWTVSLPHRRPLETSLTETTRTNSCTPWRARLRLACQQLGRYLANAWLLTLLGAGAAFAGSTPVLLDDRATSVDLWPAVTLLSDPGKSLRLDTVLASSGAFTRPTTSHATLGLRTDAVWLRIPLAVGESGQGDWVLDIDYAVLNRIDVYLLADRRVVQQALLGNLQRPSDGGRTARTPATMLRLQPSTAYELVLRVENIGAMILPITLSRPGAYHARALNEQMLQGLLAGAGLCLLLYSLVQWAGTREPLFSKYALLISGSLLFSVLQFGIGAQYLWGDNHWMELHMGGLSALIAASGSFLFIEQVLAGPRRSRHFSRVMKGGAAVLLLTAVAYALGVIDVRVVTAMVGTVGMLPPLMGIPGAVQRLRAGDRIGAYLLSAWVVYFITTAIAIGLILGRLPVGFWTQHAFQFGATFDMIMFLQVLGLRTQAVHAAARQADQERDAMHSLAHSDPLTGVLNRRALYAALARALAACSPSSLLAVFFLDLDGFKQVNDEFGHDTGDELLVAIAQRLHAKLRNDDMVARLGGDEFVVVAQGLHNDAEAAELGAVLLASFQAPFDLKHRRCQVGVTVGYALAPLDAVDVDSMVKRADAAMYAGKQSGKNCVRRGGASPGMSQPGRL